MSLLRIIKQQDACLGIWKIEESISQLLSLLDTPALYLQDLERFSSESRKLEWLSVRALCHEMAGHDCNIAYHSSGKPYLPDGGYISISHTHGYVAVLYHPFFEVGVDIEQYSERVKRVSSRFLCQDELLHIPQANETYALLLHWSAKETIFKVMNATEVDFANHIHLKPFKVESEGEFQGEEYKSAMHQHYQIRYFTTADFVLTWTIVD